MRVENDLGDLLGTSPAEGDARSAVPVVVHDTDTGRVRRALFQPDLRACRTQADQVLDDCGIGQAGDDAGTPGDDRLGGGRIDLGIPPVLVQGSAQDAVAASWMHVRTAGRVMLARLRELTKERKNVAFESTLASRTFAPWIRELIETGYHFHLFYFWLPSADRCIKRVYERKALGGHFVPEETIRRRYEGGLRNFFELYSPIAENWSFFDNTNKPRRLIASGGVGMVETVLDAPLWDKMKEEYKHG